MGPGVEATAVQGGRGPAGTDTPMKTDRLRDTLRETHAADRRLARDFRAVSARNHEEVDVVRMCERLAAQCDHHAELLVPRGEHYGANLAAGDELPTTAADTEDPSVRLLRDLSALYLCVQESEIWWTLLGQGAKAARDQEL